MSEFPDKSLRDGVTKQAISSICAMLGFDYTRVLEIRMDARTVDVHHMDGDTITTTSIRIK